MEQKIIVKVRCTRIEEREVVMSSIEGKPGYKVPPAGLEILSDKLAKDIKLCPVAYLKPIGDFPLARLEFVSDGASPFIVGQTYDIEMSVYPISAPKPELAA